MNRYLVIVFMATASAFASRPPDAAVRAFLLYQYGRDIPDIADVCHPSPDLWMLQGAAQPEKQRMVEKLEVKVGATGLFMDTVEMDICIVELREGRIDPQFNLATVYEMHRQLVLQLLYFSLLQEESELSGVVTSVDNLSFGGVPKASYGDMDVYADILALIPVVRSSDPQKDAGSKSVSYRVPLGDHILTVRIVRREGRWKIDTDRKLTLPLEYFWR